MRRCSKSSPRCSRPFRSCWSSDSAGLLSGDNPTALRTFGASKEMRCREMRQGCIISLVAAPSLLALQLPLRRLLYLWPPGDILAAPPFFARQLPLCHEAAAFTSGCQVALWRRRHSLRCSCRSATGCCLYVVVLLQVLGCAGRRGEDGGGPPLPTYPTIIHTHIHLFCQAAKTST